jgi:hypothetical protein
MSKGYALDEDMQKYFIVSRPTGSKTGPQAKGTP